MLMTTVVKDNISCANLKLTTGHIEITGTNTFYGDSNGNAITTGLRNTFLGSKCGKVVTIGDDNTFIGNDTGKLVTTSSDLTVIGSSNAPILVTSTDLVGVGKSILTSATSACNSNVLLGNNVLDLTVTGSNENVMIGHNIATSGAVAFVRNIFIGEDVATAHTTGSPNGNVIIGYGAANNQTILGNGNVGIGQGVLSNTTGSWNTVIGNASCTVAGGGSYNIIIGAGTNVRFFTSRAIKIGFGIRSSLTTFIDGIRGVTTTVPDAVAVLVDSDGQLGTVSSSKVFKENIETIDNNVINRFHQLRAVSFDYISHRESEDKREKEEKTQWELDQIKKEKEWYLNMKDIDSNEKYIREKFLFNKKHIRKQYGLIAEEVEQLFPDLVVCNKSGKIETVQYNKLFGLLIATIQDNRKLINRLANMMK